MSEDTLARRTRSTRYIKRVLQVISFRPGNNFSYYEGHIADHVTVLVVQTTRAVENTVDSLLANTFIKTAT